jgi:flagellar basal-body rod protein FlgB
MIDRLDRELQFHQLALRVRGQRQELLASNIANADTPHYKARDLDFRTALDSARSGRSDGPLQMARTADGHLPGQSGSPFEGAIRYRNEYQPSADGNTVNMDVERAAFAENAVQIEAMLTFINGKFKTMGEALRNQ